MEIFDLEQSTSVTNVGDSTGVNGSLIASVSTDISSVDLTLNGFQANLSLNGSTYTFDSNDGRPLTFSTDSDEKEILEESITLDGIKVNDLQVDHTTGNLSLENSSTKLIIQKSENADKVSIVTGTENELTVGDNVNSVTGDEINKVTTDLSGVDIISNNIIDSDDVTLRGEAILPSGITPNESGEMTIPINVAMTNGIIIPPPGRNFTIVVKSTTPFYSEPDGDYVFTIPASDARDTAYSEAQQMIDDLLNELGGTHSIGDGTQYL